MQFKQFNSITDYHSLMFDLGIIARRHAQRLTVVKFYRLIEASLYGGSPAPLLVLCATTCCPENSGVRKAFEDMEAALRETA